MDVPDGTSLPVPMRNVSFAGHWGQEIAREVATLRPGLVIHDTFAVIGRVVAFHLCLPRVNMRAGHNLEPNRALAALNESNAVHVSDACLRSVQMLREEHGIPDATPFSYFIDNSAELNICSEPPEFLPPDQRGPFEPLEFFGSCWEPGAAPGGNSDEPFGPSAEDCLRVYVAFGTAAWMMMPEQTGALLDVLADGMAAYPNLRGLISVGSGPFDNVDPERFRRANVRVAPYVDQIGVLGHATAFVTHHGLNSTHEAIFNRVPMISCPLFGDQPVLAARCQAFGLAVPLMPDGAAGRLPTIADVHRVLDRIQAEDAVLRSRMAEAQAWEAGVMRRRPAVLRRIVGMME
jgi:UDP:flavonoid glycosyltransferase YjiC (YdhE family)